MPEPARVPKPVLQVFAKTPVRGAVKTRLAPTIGEDEALAVHLALFARTLAVATEARDRGTFASIELWCDPDPRHPAMVAASARHGVSLHAQRGADLGERMQHALATALGRGRPAVLIGSDCPALDAAYLAAAPAALRDADAVFGPAEDGGYALVGLRRNLACFAAIPWGTSAVMECTRDALRRAGASWHELARVWDVDRPADHARWRALAAGAP